MEWCTEARGSGRGTTDVGKRAQVADLLSRCLGYPKVFRPSPAERGKRASEGGLTPLGLHRSWDVREFRALQDWSLRLLDARVATDAGLAGRRVRLTRAAT
jgi:hypothetical protein